MTERTEKENEDAFWKQMASALYADSANGLRLDFGLITLIPEGEREAFLASLREMADDENEQGGGI